MARTTRTRFWRTAPGVAALAALALTACATDDEAAEFDDAEAGSQTEEQDSTAQAQVADGNSGAGEDSEDGALDEPEEADSGAEPDAAEGAAENSSDAVAQTSEGPIDPADAVQTVEYTIPASDIDGSITLGLHHLEVKGNTMELLLTFTPEFSSRGAHNLYNLHGNNGGLATPALFDRENLTRYSALRASGSRFWATDVADPRVNSGETIVYWANYAVPDADIDTISVGIPAAPEFEDVEIDWGDGEPSNLDDDDGADSGEGDE